MATLAGGAHEAPAGQMLGIAACNSCVQQNESNNDALGLMPTASLEHLDSF